MAGSSYVLPEALPPGAKLITARLPDGSLTTYPAFIYCKGGDGSLDKILRDMPRIIDDKDKRLPKKYPPSAVYILKQSNSVPVATKSTASPMPYFLDGCKNLDDLEDVIFKRLGFTGEGILDIFLKGDREKHVKLVDIQRKFIELTNVSNKDANFLEKKAKIQKRIDCWVRMDKEGSEVDTGWASRKADLQ